MVARAGATRRAKPDEEPERSEGNPMTSKNPVFLTGGKKQLQKEKILYAAISTRRDDFNSPHRRAPPTLSPSAF